jgi:hypothetical protein
MAKILRFKHPVGTVETQCVNCCVPMKASADQAKPMCKRCFRHFGQWVWKGTARTRVPRR